jgi:hypothetical protein
MSCDCESTDICIDCCDTKTVTFEQCGSVWPTTAAQVLMIINCPSCCGSQKHEIVGTFVPGPPAKATFELLPAVTCALPKGARMCDFKLVAVSATGARMTFTHGRISVR